MENVLYVLGAGFSAPLGLPVISNFLGLSKDMYQTAPDTYPHFASIFERIDRMGKAKNYVTCDLFDIEEILSTLEMETYTAGLDMSDQFTRYIADVITYCTPEFNLSPVSNMAPWHHGVFQTKDSRRQLPAYYAFVAMLFNLIFTRHQTEPLRCTRNTKPDRRFSVISMNYDMVLENLAKEIQRIYSQQPALSFSSILEENQSPYSLQDSVCLAKLHGSVDPLTIVPPTWNKGRRPNIERAWQVARHMVAEANHMVFLGYSMSPADRHMRYLMIAGLLDSLNLKTIQVVCKGHAALENYRRLLCFDKLSPLDEDISGYLDRICLRNAGKETLIFDAGMCSYR